MMDAGALKILSLTHDLSDAAVEKRALMLRAGGATVTVAGFRRIAEPVRSVAGCSAVNFGRTYNGGFIQRIWSVIREAILLGRHRTLFADADVIIARNLEMLALAVRGRSMGSPAPGIVYESLDIHRLLLDRGLTGSLLRKLEGWLSRRASALVTSSPAFVSNYFGPLSQVRLPVRLVENKVLHTNEAPARLNLAHRPPGPPWRVGWFGIIRCRKSMEMLAELVRRSAGAVEVVIRGRPAPDQLEDFDKRISETPGLRFLGPYRNPDDLALIYSGVHFTWAIDMFEEGLNSSWLLPNRLYEGGLFGSVPIAEGSVESGRFLKSLGIGVALNEPLGSALADFFGRLTPAQYHALESAALSVPQSAWVYDSRDCKALVSYLRSLPGGNPHGE
jgi:succinoglycan biosynthesis protein ExoL